jgi:hypothetical protein
MRRVLATCVVVSHTSLWRWLARLYQRAQEPMDLNQPAKPFITAESLAMATKPRSAGPRKPRNSPETNIFSESPKLDGAHATTS